MPESMIAIISSVVATGRMMKGRDGLMEALLDALVSDHSRVGAIGYHGARRDRRLPFCESAGAVVAFPVVALPGVAFPGVAVAGDALRSAGPAARLSASRGTTLAPLRSLSAPSTTTRSPGERPD